MAGKVEFKKLEECHKCHYVACICPVLRDHKPECLFRRTVLNVIPKVECEAHKVVACTICSPCDCRGKR